MGERENSPSGTADQSDMLAVDSADVSMSEKQRQMRESVLDAFKCFPQMWHYWE